MEETAEIYGCHFFNIECITILFFIPLHYLHNSFIKFFMDIPSIPKIILRHPRKAIASVRGPDIPCNPGGSVLHQQFCQSCRFRRASHSSKRQPFPRPASAIPGVTDSSVMPAAIMFSLIPCGASCSASFAPPCSEMHAESPPENQSWMHGCRPHRR